MSNYACMSTVDASAARLCLIGEADPFLARLLRRFAERCGMQARRVQTGDDLLALARREQPLVVLFDPELPGRLRGWDAGRALCAGPETAAIPLVLCSWLPERQACDLVGQPLPYLLKPDLHFEQFTAVLRAAGVQM
ncbi:MAG: response regulator [Chloroflexota bacterium]